MLWDADAFRRWSSRRRAILNLQHDARQLVPHIETLWVAATKADREKKTTLDYVAEKVPEPGGASWRLYLGVRFEEIDRLLVTLLRTLD